MTQRQLAYWIIPSGSDAKFAANMESVLETDERPYDADFSVICIDE